MTPNSTARPTAAARAPNILLVMADQLAAPALPAYGHRQVLAPHLDALARQAVVFDSAYCNFPICAPSRFSMLSGRLPHAIEAYDNASEFPAATPTMAHYLRHAGYRTILCGKMHFIGPDQLHGYEERLTTDIYPADFAWTPDWTRGPSHRPTGVSMRPVVESGPCIRSMQIDYDDEVEYRAVQRLHDLARAPEQQPFFMTVSFTHPHPPFVAPQRHWDLYPHEAIEPPRVGEIAYEDLDEHSRWLYVAHAQNLYTVTPEHVRNARHAYFAMISYVDEKIGSVLRTLKETGLADDTVVVFAGDHGEMLGDQSLWGKTSCLPQAYHIPLLIRDPRPEADAARGLTIADFTENVDLLPTIMDWLGQDAQPHWDGQSLMPYLSSGRHPWPRQAVSWEFDFRHHAGARHGPVAALPASDRCLTAVLSSDALYVHFPSLAPLSFSVEWKGAASIDYTPRSGRDAQPIREWGRDALLALRMRHADNRRTHLMQTANGIRSVAPFSRPGAAS